MSVIRLLSACVLSLWLMNRALTADIDIEELRPGLVAVYRDPAKPPIEFVKLDPTVAVSWKAGESAHPRLAAEGGSVEWQGFINVLRAGNYRFSARVIGKLNVSVGGKDVLSLEGKIDKPDLQQGPAIRLESGPQPLAVKFVRFEGPARLELLWQSPAFRAEPIPYDALFHLPAKVPARIAADNAIERGRFLAEENNCAACHRPDANDKLAKGLDGRKGPDLSQIGGRVHADWLHHWLSDPHKFREGAAMPKVFADDETGRIEVYAVARYLSSLTGTAKPAPAPKPIDPKQLQVSIATGQKLFTSLGCIACHQDSKEAKADARQPGVMPIRQNFPLRSLNSKIEPEKLTTYLLDPLAIDPSGRMPNMLLDSKDATELARFLCDPKQELVSAAPKAPADAQRETVYKRLKPTDDELAVFGKLNADGQWLALGQRLTIGRGCSNCHTISPGGKALPAQGAKSSFEVLKSGKTLTAGCLADDVKGRGTAPTFALNDADRKALRSFLVEGTKGAGSPAPTHTARVTLHRFNCFACHSRNGKGGLTTEISEELRRYEKAENAEAVSPPPLTGVGHKLRTPWLKQVLTQKGRARPWMGLRMPQFGEANVGKLADALAYLEGTEPDETIYKSALSAAVLDAGKHLVGKNAFGCISCHDLAGIPNTGTRGPDLAYMNQRVRYDWYLRWLSEAQRLQPGTRMPTVFLDGKTQLANVLDGKADSQADAMWAYLSLGPTLPLPVGMEPAIKGRIMLVTDKPVLLRCFMPETGARAIAVGFPGGVSVSFDANTCRLGYAWSGNFLDVEPIWDGRGGNPVKVLGARFWTAPTGVPWAVHDSLEPPDFSAQAKDPAYGGPVPDSKVFQGVKQLQFLGYSTDDKGLPTFRYIVAAGTKNPLTVAERPQPLRSAVAVGVCRNCTLSIPANHSAWLLAGETSGEPKVLDAKGEATSLDLKTNTRLEVPTDRPLLLPQGDKVVVLSLATAPKGTTWLVQKQGNVWQVLLRLPTSTKAQEVNLSLKVWSPYRAEAALLKELASAK